MKKIGNQTFLLQNPISIVSTASIVGPKEKAGPLHQYFDKCLEDEFWGEKSWESAESKFVKETVNTAISKSGIPNNDIDLCFAGDLLNQCIASSFGLREINIPFIGLFGACSTFVEAMIVASSFIDGDFATNAIVCASSHFCSAEKQFRFPLELGNQRPPSSQWTVTGAGSAVLSKNGSGPFIKAFTPRKNYRYGN
jgi:stage V sporulation protein AD